MFCNRSETDKENKGPCLCVWYLWSLSIEIFPLVAKPFHFSGISCILCLLFCLWVLYDTRPIQQCTMKMITIPDIFLVFPLFIPHKIWKGIKNETIFSCLRFFSCRNSRHTQTRMKNKENGLVSVSKSKWIIDDCLEVHEYALY